MKATSCLLLNLLKQIPGQINEFWTATAASIMRWISSLFYSCTFIQCSRGCKNLLQIKPCTFFFLLVLYFVSSSSQALLPHLITESIKKAIKHHAGNMYNPLNKSWIKYANSNNGMLISALFCLHYWFARVGPRTQVTWCPALRSFKISTGFTFKLSREFIFLKSVLFVGFSAHLEGAEFSKSSWCEKKKKL